VACCSRSICKKWNCTCLRWNRNSNCWEITWDLPLLAMQQTIFFVSPFQWQGLDTFFSSGNILRPPFLSSSDSSSDEYSSSSAPFNAFISSFFPNPLGPLLDFEDSNNFVAFVWWPPMLVFAFPLPEAILPTEAFGLSPLHPEAWWRTVSHMQSILWESIELTFPPWFNIHFFADC